MMDQITQLAVEYLRAHDELRKEEGPFGVMPDKLPNLRKLELLRLMERVAWRKYQDAQHTMIMDYVQERFNV